MCSKNDEQGLNMNSFGGTIRVNVVFNGNLASGFIKACGKIDPVHDTSAFFG